MKMAIRELRDMTILLNNPNESEYIKQVFNTYIVKSIPPMPGFFEGGYIEFPLECSKEVNAAYKTISNASYRFHALDADFKYINQENHFKYHGHYEN